MHSRVIVSLYRYVGTRQYNETASSEKMGDLSVSSNNPQY